MKDVKKRKVIKIRHNGAIELARTMFFRMMKTKNIRLALVKEGFRPAQANDICRAARKREDIYYRK